MKQMKYRQLKLPSLKLPELNGFFLKSLYSVPSVYTIHFLKEHKNKQPIGLIESPKKEKRNKLKSDQGWHFKYPIN